MECGNFTGSDLLTDSMHVQLIRLNKKHFKRLKT